MFSKFNKKRTEVKCRKCSGPLRESVTNEKIRTAFSEQKYIILEDLPILECKICAEIIYTEQTNLIIQAARDNLRKKFREEREERKRSWLVSLFSDNNERINKIN